MLSSIRPSLGRSVLKFLVGAASLAAASSAWAAWPEKPITLVVGYAAGGSVDAVARLVSAPLAERLGQSIVIENVGGAGGSIGATRTAQSAPDGYTFMIGSGSEVAIAWAVNPALKYNGLVDLAPVGLISTSPMVLVGNSKLPVNDLNGLLALAGTKADGLSLATSGVGTPQHLLLEYVNKKTGANILHVPYRSASSILQDVIGGRVDMSILTLSTALPYISSGQLKAFAVTGREPVDTLPGVAPLTQNAKLKDDVFDLWFGMLAPKGVDESIIKKMNQELNAVLQEPKVVRDLKKQGMAVAAGTPAEFGAYIKADSAKYQNIIKDAGITVSQ